MSCSIKSARVYVCIVIVDAETKNSPFCLFGGEQTKQNDGQKRRADSYLYQLNVGI